MGDLTWTEQVLPSPVSSCPNWKILLNEPTTSILNQHQQCNYALDHNG